MKQPGIIARVDVRPPLQQQGDDSRELLIDPLAVREQPQDDQANGEGGGPEPDRAGDALTLVEIREREKQRGRGGYQSRIAQQHEQHDDAATHRVADHAFRFVSSES